MNVLFLDQFTDLGGAQQCLLDLLPAILSNGWHATVAVPGEGPLTAAMERLVVPIATFTCGPFSPGRKSPADFLRFATQIVPLSQRLAWLARETCPDIVHVNGPRLLPAVAAARLRAPVLFHSHHNPAGTADRVAAGWSINRLRATVVANCRFVANTWERFCRGGRLHVAYNGVAAPPPPRRPRGPGPLIGCIGRICPQKGQHRFIEAARYVSVAVPSARFVIQGAPLFHQPASDDYLVRVHRAAADLPVEFLPWADGASILPELDLLIVPSAFPEATTRVVLEAFAARVPVLALRCGGIEEIVHDGVTGFLARTAEELGPRAAALLTSDREHAQRAAGAAYETWTRHFTLESYQARLLSVLAATANRARCVR